MSLRFTSQASRALQIDEVMFQNEYYNVLAELKEANISCMARVWYRFEISVSNAYNINTFIS